MEGVQPDVDVIGIVSGTVWSRSKDNEKKMNVMVCPKKEAVKSSAMWLRYGHEITAANATDRCNIPHGYLVLQIYWRCAYKISRAERVFYARVNSRYVRRKHSPLRGGC